MIPIPKAVIDLAVTVLAAITSEVLDKRSAAKRSTATNSAIQREARKRRSANDEGIFPHDRPS